MPKHSIKQVGLFTQTYDQFSDRQDSKRSEALKKSLTSSFSKSKAVHLVLPQNLQDDTNEGMRAAFYKYHDKIHPLSGILGVRVIRGRHTDVIYCGVSSSQNVLYQPLQQIISPLDIKGVMIENDFQGSAMHAITTAAYNGWADEKSLIPPSTLPSRDSWEHSMNALICEMNRVLNASYTGKNADSRKRHELNSLINKLANAGYIDAGHAKFLKGARERIREFSEKDLLDSLRGALHLICNATGAAAAAYKRTMGIELPDIMLSLIDGMVENQLHPEPIRNMLAKQIPLVTTVLNNDPSVAHIPVFYVPVCADTDAPRCAAYLPCVDIELTVEAADKIIHSTKYQAIFKKAIENWAKKL